MATKLEGEALVATKKTTFFAASLTRRGLIFKLNIGSNYLSDSSLSFFVSFSLSEYVCTGRYPVQASVMFLKELIISLSLSIILSPSLSCRFLSLNIGSNYLSLSLFVLLTLSLSLSLPLSLSLCLLYYSLSLSLSSRLMSLFLFFVCLFPNVPFLVSVFLCVSICVFP